MSTDDNRREWQDARETRWIVPVTWWSWSQVQLSRGPTGGLAASLPGDLELVTLNTASLTLLWSFACQRAPRLAPWPAAADQAAIVEESLNHWGPLRRARIARDTTERREHIQQTGVAISALPEAMASAAYNAALSYVDVPRIVDVHEEYYELSLLSLGLRVAQALTEGEESRLSRLIQEMSADASATIPGKPLPRVATTDVLTRWAEDDNQAHGWPSGDVGIAMQWLGQMATRWPLFLWPDARHGGALVPLAMSPAEVSWLSLAHTVGAVKLPFPPGVAAYLHWCGNPKCGKPIFSSRPRHSGKRWFCDPPPGLDKSPCANRFFALESKKRARARREAERAATSMEATQ